MISKTKYDLTGGCILVGLVQGAIIWKLTGRPRQDAASMRRGTSVSGYTPVQAARASKLTKGSHSGSTGVKRLKSKPAAVKNAAQFGGGEAAGASTWAGTAANSIKRPCG